jgi:hypothetical protein
MSYILYSEQFSMPVMVNRSSHMYYFRAIITHGHGSELCVGQYKKYVVLALKRTA